MKFLDVLLALVSDDCQIDLPKWKFQLFVKRALIGASTSGISAAALGWHRTEWVMAVTVGALSGVVVDGHAWLTGVAQSLEKAQPTIIEGPKRSGYGTLD